MVKTKIFSNQKQLQLQQLELEIIKRKIYLTLKVTYCKL